MRLADAIPFLARPKNPDLLTAVYEEKRKLHWKNWQKKATANIKSYYEELSLLKTSKKASNISHNSQKGLLNQDAQRSSIAKALGNGF